MPEIWKKPMLVLKPMIYQKKTLLFGTKRTRAIMGVMSFKAEY
jgi:hypothetical protein